jgi:SAM-dependent methyltransferase
MSDPDIMSVRSVYDAVAKDFESFDIAVAPLMIHHVTARIAALREVARVLTTDGCLIVSTSHPFADWQNNGGSYFATELVQDTWSRSSDYQKLMEHPGFIVFRLRKRVGESLL